MLDAGAVKRGDGHRWKLWRRLVVTALGLAIVVAWLRMMNAAQGTLSFEPNADASIAAARAARPVATWWATLEMALVAVLAWVTRRTALLALGAPGLAAAVVLLFVPSSNGGAFVLAAAVSILSVAFAAFSTLRSVRGRRGASSTGIRPGP